MRYSEPDCASFLLWSTVAPSTGSQPGPTLLSRSVFRERLVAVNFRDVCNPIIWIPITKSTTDQLQVNTVHESCTWKGETQMLVHSMTPGQNIPSLPLTKEDFLFLDFGDLNLKLSLNCTKNLANYWTEIMISASLISVKLFPTRNINNCPLQVPFSSRLKQIGGWKLCPSFISFTLISFLETSTGKYLICFPCLTNKPHYLKV